MLIISMNFILFFILIGLIFIHLCLKFMIIYEMCGSTRDLMCVANGKLGLKGGLFRGFLFGMGLRMRRSLGFGLNFGFG